VEVGGLDLNSWVITVPRDYHYCGVYLLNVVEGSKKSN
jgi:hypothetical protein